jgi:hypothetical protein
VRHVSGLKKHWRNSTIYLLSYHTLKTCFPGTSITLLVSLWQMRWNSCVNYACCSKLRELEINFAYGCLLLVIPNLTYTKSRLAYCMCGKFPFPCSSFHPFCSSSSNGQPCTPSAFALHSVPNNYSWSPVYMECCYWTLLVSFRNCIFYCLCPELIDSVLSRYICISRH